MAAQDYFAILTATGEAKLAAAAANKQQLKLTAMAVGDGAGNNKSPDRLQQTLRGEVYRAELNQLTPDQHDPSLLLAEMIIPETVGGWWVRELALFDDAGDMCAVANCPDSYKPLLVNGSGKVQIIRMLLAVSSSNAVQLKIDPAIVLAPRSYVEQLVQGHEKTANPHPQYITPLAVGDQIRAQAPTIRARDFIDGDDHASAWLAAIRKASQLGMRVDVSGNWTFRSKCDAAGYDVSLFGAATIDASAVPGADFALVLGGKLGDSAPLGANIAAGAAGIACALQPQPGDIIRLKSTEPWSTERDYYGKGELCRVLAAVGGTIYLQAPLQDSYTAATTTVTILQAAAVSIDQGITIKRNADAAGLAIQYARDPAITRPIVYQARERCISIKESIGGHVTMGFALADMPATGSTGTHYGLVLESCADTWINGGSFRAGRHGIATGGTFPCRDIKFSKCIVDNDHNSKECSLDAHANGERFTYEDIFNKNGATIQAVDCAFRGGNWQAVSVAACLSLYPARTVNRYQVDGIWCYNAQPAGKGLTYSNAVAGINLGSLIISNSRLVADVPLYVLPRLVDTQFDTISLNESCTLQSLGITAGSGALITHNDAVSPLIKRVIVKAKLIGGAQGKVLTIISSNKTIDYAEVSGTTVEHSANDNAVLIQKAKIARFAANHCSGFGTSQRVELAYCDRTISGGNHFIGFNSVGGLYLNSNTENLKLGGDYSDAPGGLAASQVYTTYYLNERHNKITYGPVAPTSGAWRIGDTCYNNAPGGSGGWVSGWQCTAAGSPGTWKAISTLN